MTLTILNVIYVLLAIAMIGFILVQRGSGAQAGSGFGAGASATVFGARGASNFLTKTTKWLAIAFFGLTLAMAMLIVRGNYGARAIESGVMGSVVPAATDATPPAATDVPAAPADASATPATAPASDVPAAPASATPADAAPTPPAAQQSTPAPAQPATTPTTPPESGKQ